MSIPVSTTTQIKPLHNVLADKKLLPKKILILGSGGLKVGQAGEFDYSGSQAIKAFKEEGIKTILVNPNIATVQTDQTMADEIYFVPLSLEVVSDIIKKEQVDAIALGFGGQTALNLGLSLYHSGLLTQHNITILGSSIDAITATEDRGIFRNTLNEHGIKTPISHLAVTKEEALSYAKEIGYPLMMRSGFSLGGLGSSIITTEAELTDKVTKAFSVAPQVLIEECLIGYKEFEYEIVRDMSGNSLTVCNMENLDPMGIHTGESIVIAPSQTLNDKDHQMLRNISLRCAAIFNIIGECNIQFALNPANGDYRVIEMNPRLSRSSALASKATGYPLAFIAAKLCLGYNLHELKNQITKQTTAFFEPALDYVVVKMPRWDTNKLRLAERNIGTEMKSVGESMAIGRTFPEALQKAIGALNIGASGLTDYPWPIADLANEIEYATDRRIFALYQWFASGKSVEEAHSLAKIDHWFLYQIKEIADYANYLAGNTQSSGLASNVNSDCLNEYKSFACDDYNTLLKAKLLGFSDIAIAKLFNTNPNITTNDNCYTEDKIRNLRVKLNITPKVKQIDTLAGEFDAKTNYLYLTYHGDSHDVTPSKEALLIVGSGPYAIGSSVEFDWCTVNLAREFRRYERQVIIINSNPETVSTDYDESNKLYFEPLTLERVRDILDFEQVGGVCVSVGGQAANNLALPLALHGYNLLGTSATDIDQAENREKFSLLLEREHIDQPRWINARNIKEIEDFIKIVGFPVLIRPSYVLSGAAMKVVFNQESLVDFLQIASIVSKDHPVVISEFIDNAKELEIDGVARNGKIVIYAVSEHIENAGVHSGDATIVFPPERLYIKTVLRAKDIADKIVANLKINGPFNMQFIAKHNALKVIECNVRSSRSFPFISKVTGHNFIAIMAKILLNIPCDLRYNTLETKFVGVKSPLFSYNRFKGADPVAQVEMSSTGEVACIAPDIFEAFYMSWLATGVSLNGKRILLSVSDAFKERLVAVAKRLANLGFEFVATEGTHDMLAKEGIQSQCVFKVSQAINPNIKDVISSRQVDLIINLPLDIFTSHNDQDGFIIRRLAIDYNIPLITNFHLAEMLLESLALYYNQKLTIKSYSDYLSANNSKSIHQEAHHVN